ncbi:dynactin P62 subunit [Culex quinquefasciatus]|uniref:Dynactin P62 subunit n=1 Tax=Culex quinquefasciatus TaxID=7176 RepID=B0WAN8_CULQU|nr:dynactin P62 subunit [Culex quinquefasciatus]|eukprot:XP_001845772.1 dynactin P62 subunit [Culex quinquefasciatus]
MGVRKRPTEKEQLLEPVPVFCHDEDKHEWSDLRVEWGNIAILFFLYLLQGILMKLVAAFLMMLQNRGASYKQQVHVECWAGRVQLCALVVQYEAAVGADRRLAYLMELFMLILGLHGDLFGTAAVVWFTPAMIYDLHVPYYYYLILLTKYGLYQIALYTIWAETGPPPCAVDGRRADVAATAGEEGKKEEPPTAGNQWHQGSGRSRSTRMRLDLDCCCRLRRKTPKTSKFLSLTDRTGVTVSMIRRQMGWTDSEEQIKATPSPINRSVAIEAVDEFADGLLTKPIQWKNITTRLHILAQPAKQPFTCRQCDHNANKSEYNPSSIKYRIAKFSALHPVRAAHVQPEGHPFAESNQSNHQRHDHHDNGTEPTDEEERRMIEELKLSADHLIVVLFADAGRPRGRIADKEKSQNEKMKKKNTDSNSFKL